MTHDDARPHTPAHGHGAPAPGHHHGDADMDWEVMGPLLESGAELHSTVFEQAAAWLGTLLAPPDGRSAAPVRRILDVGSGPGVATCLLARAFPDAEVVAVDPTPALLDRTRARAAALGLADRVTTHRAELPDGLDGDAAPDDGGHPTGPVGDADLIWSSRTLHHVGDQRRAVATLARHLRPGGVLALSEGGLPQRFLPRDIGLGRPGLQARLDAVTEEWFARMRAALPGAEDTVEDWPAFLTDAGLDTPHSRSFLVDLPAPLSADGRAYVAAGLTRAVEAFGDDLAPDDLATATRLLDADDPAGLARRPDVFLLAAQTVHAARAR
ncbi:class I SAM-dependent methyltransferase [Streptomyces catenulae]|uniref:Class I SAM-dependent methyltransferase n=1 Tax=Streptomyces catenulae TaxID=66875 RepID=A0ABV2Z8L3_9ACTN|nr:class I SAM-dependent methyltransferase [Streptomyces catenulae]